MTVLRLAIGEQDTQDLEELRDHSPKPYLRERAAAILKVADGVTADWVARYGLLRPRKSETVCRWVKAYLAHGLAGLHIRVGRGRKPVFSPSLPKQRSRSTGTSHYHQPDTQFTGLAGQSLDA
jgi:hypothetical protein